MMYQPPKRLRHGQDITPLEFNDLVRTAYGDSFVSAQPPLCCEWDSAGLRLWLDEAALAADNPPPAGEVCVIDGGATWVSACDPVTGSGGSFTTAIQITLPGGSTGPSFVINFPGTTTNAYTITATSSSVTVALYPPGSSNPVNVKTTDTSKTTESSYLYNSITTWMTQTGKTTYGILQFPTSNVSGKLPVGQFSPPTMITAGKPTTPTPDPNTYPEAWNSADKKLYLWDGSVWQALSADPLTTKGDLWGYGSDDARVPVGADYALLGANSTTALG